MKYFIFIIFGLLFIPKLTFAQVETVTKVKNRELFDRNTIINKFQLNENSVFIINGIAFNQSDSLKLNEKLKTISPQILTDFTFIKNKGQVGIGDKDIVVIRYAIIQRKKYIKEKQSELKKIFKDNYLSSSQHIYLNSKDPVLYIDNQKIFHTEAKNRISILKTKNIADISIKNEPQNSEMFGQNAKNGIVIIWTKKELNKACR